MKLINLKAQTIKFLHVVTDAEQLTENRFNPKYAVRIDHRGYVYYVGSWQGWEGQYWMREEATGVIVRGSLTYIKEMVVVFSASQREANGKKESN